MAQSTIQRDNRPAFLSTGDLNSITYNYHAYVGSGVSNIPRANYSGTLVAEFDNGGAYGSQTFICTYDNSVYTRTMNNGTWKAWELIDNAYKPGDIVTYTANTYIAQGVVGTGSKNITFIINLPKRISSAVAGVTFSTLNIRPFSTSGQLFSASVLTSAYSLVVSLMKEEGAVRVLITKADETAFSATALTPLNVFFVGCSFTFN